MGILDIELSKESFNFKKCESFSYDRKRIHEGVIHSCWDVPRIPHTSTGCRGDILMLIWSIQCHAMDSVLLFLDKTDINHNHESKFTNNQTEGMWS